jgi:hypothetical protein
MSKKRLLGSVGVTALMMLTFGVGLANASASTMYDHLRVVCDGAPAEEIVHVYTTRIPLAPMPMRCGTERYGVRHLLARGRYNNAFLDHIGDIVRDNYGENQGGTSYVWNAGDPPFRVVADSQRYADGQEKGLITAYYVTQGD